MYITHAINEENIRVAKQVEKIFRYKKNPMPKHPECDFDKMYHDCDIQIRYLNSELRRILKTEEYQSTFIEAEVCNTFDGVQNELIPFKVSWSKKEPPLKIKFGKESIDCTMYLSTTKEFPWAKNWDKVVEVSHDLRVFSHHRIRSLKGCIITTQVTIRIALSQTLCTSA